MNDCIFCKILKKEIPSYKIYEDEKVYAFLDIADDITGHTLVIPKNHCKNILDCNKQDLQAVVSAVQKISLHYTSVGFNGVNVFNANEECAEQTVNHLHFHILPRKNGDGKKIYPTLKKQENDLETLAKELKLPQTK